MIAVAARTWDHARSRVTQDRIGAVALATLVAMLLLVAVALLLGAAAAAALAPAAPPDELLAPFRWGPGLSPLV